MTTRLQRAAAVPRPLSDWNLELRWARRLDPIVRNPALVLGAATAAAVLCGIVLHPRSLALAGGLAMVLGLGLLWPWISLRGFRADVSFAATRGREGQPVPARLDYHHRAPWGAWGLAVQFGRRGAEASPVLALHRVDGWRRASVEWTYVPDRRGEHPVGGARVATGFPFGLRESSRPLTVERPLIVWPQTFPVGPIPDEAGGDASEGTTFRDRPGDAGDLLGVRAYRRGDPLRRIHWGQTARHGELIVCERQAAAAPRIQIVLDLDPSAHVGTGADGSREWAVRVAASFLDDWIGQGADAELVVGERVIACRGGTVASRRTHVLDAIARLDDRGDGLPLGEALAGPNCGRFGRGLRVVVCTDLAHVGDRDCRSEGAELFVVLASAAFRGGTAEASNGLISRDPRIRPWIVINDPTLVPRQVLARRKEVGDVH